MRLIYPVNILIMAVCVSTTLFSSTGCRSHRSVPKLADLAWWKKDDIRLSSTPPPPAAHFNPEPSVKMQANDTTSNDLDRNVADIENNLDAAFDSNRESGSPIREPYSMKNADVNSTSNDNSFEAVPGSLKTKLPDWSSTAQTVDRKLSEVQRELADSLKQKTRSAENKSEDFGSDWRNDFALPAKRSATGIGNEIGNSINSATEALTKVNVNVAKSAGSSAGGVQNSIEVPQTTNQFAGSIGRQIESKGVKNPGDPSLSFQPNQQASQQRPQQPRIANTQPPYSQFKKQGLPDNSLRTGAGQNPVFGSHPARPPSSNGYPSTPHGNFSQLNRDATTNSTYNSQASFDANGPKTSVSNAAGPAPERPHRNLTNNSVVLPDSISHGNGSFAPGSINPLLPISK